MGLPLSICIPSHNRARLLERTLGKLANCQDLFSEIVVSDNASADDTGEVVRSFEARFDSLRYVRQSENFGAFRNIYASMILAKSEFAFVLSDDDALVPAGIRQALATIVDDPECVAVYGGYEAWTADLGSTRGTYLPQAPGRYTRADKLAMAANANIPTFPILRRAIFQRHCFLDNTTFGFWRLIGQLLDHGAVHVVSYAIYQHADSDTRLEHSVVEPWYHDFLRSDWELYTASIEPADRAKSLQIVTGMTVPVYRLGELRSRNEDSALAERTFLVRYMAYRSEIDGAGWERTRLIAAVIALLSQRIRVATDIERLVVERGAMNLADMATHIARDLRNLTLLVVDPNEFVRFKAAPGDLLLAEYWETLEMGEAANAVDPTRYLAVADMISMLRLPGSPREKLLQGPCGTYHVALG